MVSNFLNIPVSNIYTKPNIKSEVSTQILYGEKFKILSKKKGWLNIKTNFDNYIIIDASQEIDKISDIIFKEIKKRFKI